MEKDVSRIPATCVCGHTWKVAASKGGTNVACPACGRQVVVPGGENAKDDAPELEVEPDFLKSPVAESGPMMIVSVGGKEEINWLGPGLIGGGILLLIIGLVLYGVFGGSKDPKANSPSSTMTYNSNPESIFTDRTQSGGNIFGGRGNASVGDGTGAGPGGKGTGAGDAGGQTGAAAAGTGNLNAPEGEGSVLADPNAQQTVESEGAMALATPGASSDVPEDGLNVPELAGPGSPKSANVGGGGTFGARGKKGGGFGRGGMTAQSQQAVVDGLAWLAKNQEKDGRWDCRKWAGNDAFDLGITGLATLAFLADGHTHLDVKGADKKRVSYNAVVKRALEYILSQQQADGSFTRRTFYEQGIATIVLCELIGMTDDGSLIEPAQRAIDYIISQVGPQGGYTYTGPGTDMSVTGFQVMAIKSAILANLNVPEDYLEKIKGFLKIMTTPEGLGRYQPTDAGKISMTAAVLFCRIFLEYGLDDPDVIRGAKQLKSFAPDVKDEYYTYYATYCMYQLGDEAWVKWNNVVRDAVLANQEKKDPNLRGSWAPDKSVYAQGGRIYVTAMNIMTLEVYYRYLPIYK